MKTTIRLHLGTALLTAILAVGTTPLEAKKKKGDETAENETTEWNVSNPPGEWKSSTPR